jgi:hypothetical protein
MLAVRMITNMIIITGIVTTMITTITTIITMGTRTLMTIITMGMKLQPGATPMLRNRRS